MNIVVHLVVISVFLFVSSCAVPESIVVKEKTFDQQKTKRLVIKDGQFEAWNDFTIDDTTLANSINLSDKMIKYKQWADAKNKLSLTLRKSSTYAPVWSRLSWLSLRSAQLKKAIRLANKSNSYTDSNSLKKLNWSFIRDAYKLMGKTNKMAQANKMILQLSGETR